MVSPIREAAVRCGSCGNELRPQARFCDGCGARVAARSSAGEHKQVTVLFADVVGSMKLASALDAERLREIMHELFNRAAAAVQRYQGMVDKFTGDGLMALFGAPSALEDHALRACIAALEIQSVATQLAAEVDRRDGVALRLRIGLNSGDVIVGEIGSGPGSFTAVGHPVGMAQRMEAAAPPGGVLCSLSTARLVQDATRLGPVEDVAVKGADAAVPARRLLGVESDRAVLGRNEGLMLGREAEVDQLRQLLDADRSCLVGIVGDPGLGKSRLTAEFAAIAAGRGAAVVVARCESHTTTIAFRALSRLLRAMFAVHGLDAAEAREHTMAQCAGPLTPHSTDARILFDAMGIDAADGPAPQVSADARRRRLVEVMAQAVRARPARTVFVVEDAHWIDAPSDDVLAAFAAALAATTSLFVTTYRPEYRGALHRNSGQTVTLRPLTDATAVRLAGQLVGPDPSLAGLAERIAAAAAGNPFFAEEIVRDLAGRGVLVGNRGRYRLTGDVDEIAVPATVQAALAARIDRLPAEAKSILNAAAVIGSQFDVGTVQALRPDTDTDSLAELVAAELIDQTEFVPRQRYCFRHPLVRAVAYESQLTAARVQAHTRLAAAIQARDPAAADENAALIATHLEAAGELAAAYRWHMRAAEWLRLRDLPAAHTQWEGAQRIADRLPDDHDALALRIAPRTMLISTAFFVGGGVDTDARYREFRDLTTQAGDTLSLAIATAGRIWSLTVGDNRVPDAAALATELQEMVDAVDCDPQTKGILLFPLAYVRFVTCDFDAACRVTDAIAALPQDEPAVEIPLAHALRGVIDVLVGDYERGRRSLRYGSAQGRALPPGYHAQLSAYWGMLAWSGLDAAKDLVDDMRDALGRAEAFGDVSDIIVAQWGYGTVLLRAGSASRDEAIAMLERARAGILKHRIWTAALATIAADLAVHAAREGQRDNAIDDLRTLFATHMTTGTRALAGCPGEALVALLIDRGDGGDLAEAHRIVDQWQAQRPGIPGLDLWWLKSRAVLAGAEGDADGYTELAEQYLEMCEKLDARGRLDEARLMVNQIG